MPPHFFEPEQHLNQEDYLDLLSTVVKPWMDIVTAGRPFLFQKDSTPAHGVKTSSGSMSPSSGVCRLGPSSFTDLTSLDYHV
ncbi:Transposable element tcb2 transposase [Caligus rogercresseyi]|uniref:Transposable element tcb2 transposase n=1 Tax=Caligus rogercresseyi TaxID=217165 RepID=A0A7T8GV88_CALRO|nr:Transposable element tcb2 transposase [Caligus rogercresseyi]